jgi:hypothetical protein
MAGSERRDRRHTVAALVAVAELLIGGSTAWGLPGMLDRVVSDPAWLHPGPWQVTPSLDCEDLGAKCFRLTKADSLNVGLASYREAPDPLVRVRFSSAEPWRQAGELASPAALLDTAVAFAKRYSRLGADYSPRVTIPPDLTPPELQPWVIVRVWWVHQPSGFHRGRVHLWLDPTVGLLREWEDTAQAVPDEAPAIQPGAARRIATEAAAKRLKTDATSVRIAAEYRHWTDLRGQPPTGLYCYYFTQQGPAGVGPSAGQILVAEIEVNARTGACVTDRLCGVDAREMRRLAEGPEAMLAGLLATPVPIIDAYPQWLASDKLAFTTNRRHIGANAWVRTSALATTLVPDGAMSWLLPGWWPGTEITLDSEPRSSYLALGEAGPVLDLAPKGRLELLNCASRERVVRKLEWDRCEQPDRVGSRVVFTGDADGRDLLVADYNAQRGAFGALACLGCDESRPRYPALSPDGQKVYFVAEAPRRRTGAEGGGPFVGGPGVRGSIASVPVRLAGRRAVVTTVSRDWQGVTGLSRVGRDERLLLSAAGVLWLVNLADGQRSRLPGQPYTEPDTGERLSAAQAKVSPDGTTVAFVAQSKGAGQHPWFRCIYLVRLDGTGLRRLTPRADPTVPPAYFDALKTSALDLNKAWWLEREAERVKREGMLR